MSDTFEFEGSHGGAPWGALKPGDRFEVSSLRGHAYSLSFLAPPAEDGTNLYVRMEDGKLARFDASRVDWTTLDVKAPGDACLPGDEVLVRSGGVEHRGELIETITESIVLVGSRGKVALPLGKVELESFRVAFPAAKAQVGDEFLVVSLSGKKYRGHAHAVSSKGLVVQLDGADAKVRMNLDHLALDTLRILVAVQLSALGCSPVA